MTTRNVSKASQKQKVHGFHFPSDLPSLTWDQIFFSLFFKFIHECMQKKLELLTKKGYLLYLKDTKKRSTQTASDFYESFQESCDANHGEITG